MATARKPLFKTPEKTDAGQSLLNFAICVKAYDLKSSVPTVTGTRLDTGEEVSVSLGDTKGLNKGKFQRPEIVDFAKPRKFRNDPGVEIGGTLFIQSPRPLSGETDNVFSCRWITALSHDATEAEIITCIAHYPGARMGKAKSDGTPGKSYCNITAIYDFNGAHLSDKMADALNYIPPFTTDSVEQLRSDLIQLLDRNLGVGIRFVEMDGNFDALSLNRGIEKDPDLEKIVDTFISAKMPDGLDEMLASGLKMELIPFSNIRMGSKSAADTLTKQVIEQESGKIGSTMSKVRRYSSDSPEYPGRTNARYGKSIVAVRLVEPEDGSPSFAYFTAIEPIFTPKETVIGLRNALLFAQTENFCPEIEFAPSSANSMETNTSPNTSAAVPAAVEPAAVAPAQPELAATPIKQPTESAEDDQEFMDDSQERTMLHEPVADTPVPARPARRAFVSSRKPS